MEDEIGLIEQLVYGFMGYCSVRYTQDDDMAISDKDKESAEEIAKQVQILILKGKVEELNRFNDNVKWVDCDNTGYDGKRIAELTNQIKELEG